METPELRKIQITGGATYSVSLPKRWAKEVGLKQGARVFFIPQADASLLLVPQAEVKPGEVKEARMEIGQSQNPEVVVRELISLYLVGFDTMRMGLGPETGRHRAVLKELIKRKLMGVEIVEESSSELVAQCLLGYREMPVDKALHRMSILASLMHKDALVALRTWDHSLAHGIIDRDDEVDRFYFFIVRQLKQAVNNRSMIEELGLSSPADCLGYRIVVKSIERVADHAARIAGSVMVIGGGVKGKLWERIENMSGLSQEAYEASLKSLYKADVKLAHETILKASHVADLEEKIANQLTTLDMGSADLVKIRLVLESIRRIAEYSADIAEIVLNLNANKTVTNQTSPS